MTEAAAPVRVVEETPAYWRVVFDYPPFNMVDATIFEGLQELLARMGASPSLHVVVFESANPDFYLAHFDLTGKTGNITTAVGPSGLPILMDSGEILVELNQQPTKVFVVVEGKLEALRVSDNREEVFAIFGPGMFTGELNLLSGRRALARIRAAELSELIEIEREALLNLVQTDSGLSDVLLRAYILRRLELIARGIGDLVLIGSSHSLDTFRIKEFLIRNYQPYSYVDLDREADVQDLLDRFHVAITDLPVLICRRNVVLRNPTNEEITNCLGFNEAVDEEHVRDTRKRRNSALNY